MSKHSGFEVTEGRSKELLFNDESLEEREIENSLSEMNLFVR